MADTPPTPTGTLERAWLIGRDAGLRYVYVGNVPGNHSENTFCPQCGQVAVERTGYTIGRVHVRDGRCDRCSTAIAGVW
jgi:pyruvate formate lyase activating enzyme